MNESAQCTGMSRAQVVQHISCRKVAWGPTATDRQYHKQPLPKVPVRKQRLVKSFRCSRWAAHTLCPGLTGLPIIAAMHRELDGFPSLQAGQRLWEGGWAGGCT